MPRADRANDQLADVSPLARTPEIICRICRTRTPSEISNSIWSSSTTLVTLPTRPPEVTTVSPRRMFFTSSAWSLTFFCCGRRIRKYMITKISANGRSDINMLLVSPPPAAWAYAGVISIRTILVRWLRTGDAWRGPVRGQIRADYSDRGPNCNVAWPLIWACLQALERPDMAAPSGTCRMSKNLRQTVSRASARKPAKVAAKRPTAPDAQRDDTQDDTPLRIARALEAIAAHLSASTPVPVTPQAFGNAEAFVWHPHGRLAEVPHVS